jgi:hypothetical protein
VVYILANVQEWVSDAEGVVTLRFRNYDAPCILTAVGG